MVLGAAIVMAGLFIALRPNTGVPAPQERKINLSVGTVKRDPAELIVREGDRVTIEVSSERPLQFHLHGYDIQREVQPGAPATIAFEATLTGRFQMEDEVTKELLGSLIVEPR